MRILQIVHQYVPDQVGGTELYTQSLAQGLSQQGHTVAVFTRRDRPGQGWAEEKVAGIQVYAAWAGVLTPAQRYGATFHNPALLSAFRQIVQHFQPDLIHIEHLMGLPLALLNVVQAAGLPYVVTLHDFWWICANANLLTNYSGEHCAGPIAHLNCTRCVVARATQRGAWLAAPVITGTLAWRAHQLRRILAGAAQIVVFSEFVRQWHVEQGVSADRLRVLPPGVEPPPAALRRNERDPGKPLRFLYLGGIARLKGIHILLEAFRQVQGAVELWIAGDLAFDPAYSAQLRQLATPQVTFLGRLDRQTVWQTLTQVDAVLVPSLWPETYCLVPREAYAVGVPVIAAQIGALGELVRNEVDGLLVPPGDVQAWRAALQSVIDEPQRLEQFRLAIGPSLGWDDHVEQISKLYQERCLSL